MRQRLFFAAMFILTCFQFFFFVKNTGNRLQLPIRLYIGTTNLFAAPLSSAEPNVTLKILYGDTLIYDPSTTINGCSGERIPVTIRALNDENNLVTTNAAIINLNIGTGLKAYAAATSTEPITTTQLVAGQVVIYIQAITKNVADGTIGAVASDGSIKSGERGGIFFKTCFKRVDHGAFFATNGRGSVDKVEIYYTEALDPNEIPDSILLCWPGSSTDCRTVYMATGNIVQDPSNPAQVIVTPPVPFPEAITKVNGLNLDLAFVFWVNPDTPDAPSINQSVAMQDSVGPLLLTATVIERLRAGDDTLIVTFTEPVEYNKLVGQTLILIKNGQQIPLTIKNAQPGSNQAVVVTVDNSLDNSNVIAGDSLMIVSASTVSDNNGNKPHPQNRPVVVQLSAVAPTLVSAYYRDGNGDGIVDTVRATFSKAVVLNNAMALKIKFAQKESSNVDPAKMAFVDGTGNTTIDIRMDYLFSIFDLQDKTSGAMSVSASFFEFEKNNRSVVIAGDRAAPVLVAVEYHFGKMGESSSEADYDTLYVKYSEGLKDVPSVTLPLYCINASGSSYEIPVFTPWNAVSPGYVVTGEMSGYYRFIVAEKGLSIEGGTRGPNNTVIDAKDSVWINTTAPEKNAVDAAIAENQQTIPNNKKVPVIVRQSSIVQKDFESSAEDESSFSNPCGSCGAGTLLSFIPPMFFYARQRLRKKRKQNK